MARPRGRGHKSYPEGLYGPSAPGRSFRIRHPYSGRFLSLKTKDEAVARKLHAAVYPRYLEEALKLKIEALTQALDGLGEAKAAGAAGIGALVAVKGPSVPPSPGSETVADFARDIMLPLIPKLTKRRGKLISESHQNTYRQVLTNVIEDDTGFGARPVRAYSHPDDGPQWVRAYLAPWTETPSAYNTRLGVLSRLFKTAVTKGIIARNPCDPVTSFETPRRDVYMPDDVYIQIRDTLAEGWHEVYGKCCDLIYLLSARNTDALTLEESEIQIFPDAPLTDGNGEAVYGVIRFNAAKNDADIDMDMNRDLFDLIQWFRTYKRREGVISPFLCIHPVKRTPPVPSTVLDVEKAQTMTATAISKVVGMSIKGWIKRVERYGLEGALAMGSGKGRVACTRALAGKPINNQHLRERFTEAKALAGFGDTDYVLRDLRPKGLTDEAVLKGEATNKGGWKPGSRMKEQYVRVRLPIHTSNKLKVLR